MCQQQLYMPRSTARSLSMIGIDTLAHTQRGSCQAIGWATGAPFSMLGDTVPRILSTSALLAVHPNLETHTGFPL